MMTFNNTVTAKEAATLLGVKYPTVIGYIRAGQLPARKAYDNKQYVINYDDLNEFERRKKQWKKEPKCTTELVLTEKDYKVEPVKEDENMEVNASLFGFDENKFKEYKAFLNAIGYDLVIKVVKKKGE